MANPNVTEIITKIILRNDVYEAWQVSPVILEKGEPAIVFDPVSLTAKLKIGNGQLSFNELPFSTVTPDEVRDMISESMTANGEIYSVMIESGSTNGTLKLTVNNIVYDNIAITGLGSAAFTDSSDYATADQGKRADESMIFRGTVGRADATIQVLPTININRGDTYKAVSDFEISANASYTGKVSPVIAGDIIIASNDLKWIVISCGSAEVAKSLAAGISAEVSGGISGSSTSANAGESIQINVTEVNTDYLKNGTKILILDGGNATA